MAIADEPNELPDNIGQALENLTPRDLKSNSNFTPAQSAPPAIANSVRKQPRWRIILTTYLPDVIIITAGVVAVEIFLYIRRHHDK